MVTKKPFDLHNNNYYKKSLMNIESLNCDKEFWNIDGTISELSYLTHDYFRYYGKFPSKIGKMIIEELIEKNIINKDNDFILDNYVGSGTSLVEAKLAGFDSIGFDINPFAVLACRVKTYNYDVDILKKMWMKINSDIYKYNSFYFENTFVQKLLPELDQKINNKIEIEIQEKTNSVDFNKWFSEKAISQLSIIKNVLLELPYNREREFFDLAFFAIIRRVSRAHDAEVRPHVNKKKKDRNVIEAYSKKVNEMLEKMNLWNLETNASVHSDSYIVSNTDRDVINNVIDSNKIRLNKQLGAVLSHPPYLNCFDYISVYKLKFMWAEEFAEIFGEKSYEEIKKMEIKSYPVNNDEAIDRYFDHNYLAYKNIYDILREGGYCCIVIGDCTVKGELFSVHKTFITMMEEIGFYLKKIVYRSTKYGMGRYAYSFRADYSENQDSKQDAILFFTK